MKFKVGTRVRATQIQERQRYIPYSKLKEGEDIFTKENYVDVNIDDLGTVYQKDNVMGEIHIAINWDNGSKCAYEIGHFAEIAEVK
jgi:hypothetical protein